MDEGRLDGKKKTNEGEKKQSWLGDVWRFLCVAESIRPCLSVLLFLPLAPSIDKTLQHPTPTQGKHNTDYPEPTRFPSLYPSPLILQPSLSLIALRCLSSHFPPAAALPCFSLWIHPSPSSFILLPYPSLVRPLLHLISCSAVALPHTCPIIHSF